ncbi:Serine/threonine-protein kinase MRCK beta [Frankliniella fusca]|uniref:Serine/threonine-protein kinase MRCK beta n=1 Tax=Frankliniella fusca TaxID=407009 RepID=A0AAE1HXP2_9NEOP|nr:Serine/threonine-protein kinase MRCK beta [Frankliniella fusca]
MRPAMSLLLAAVLACSLLLAAAAPAPAADEAAAATTTAPAAAAGAGMGPLAQAFETLIKEGPERAKKLGEGLRANAEKIRGRFQDDIAKLVPHAEPSPTKASLLHKVLHHKNTASTASSTASTTSTPPTSSSSSPTATAAVAPRPQPQDSDGPGPALGPTTLSPTTTTVEAKTLIGVPLRCGPGEVASRGKCREYL